MKRILTELERRSLRQALWDDVKRLPAPRHVRLLFLEQMYNDWLHKWLEEGNDNLLEHDPVVAVAGVASADSA